MKGIIVFCPFMRKTPSESFSTAASETSQTKSQVSFVLFQYTYFYLYLMEKFF